jgi:hypothetical protein
MQKKLVIITSLFFLLSSCGIIDKWNDINNNEDTKIDDVIIQEKGLEIVEINEDTKIDDEIIQEKGVDEIEIIENKKIEDWVFQEKKSNFIINKIIWEE